MLVNLSFGSAVLGAGARRMLTTSAIRFESAAGKQSAAQNVENLFAETPEMDDAGQGSGGADLQPTGAIRRRPMNKGINRVELLGGLGSDPVFRQTQTGSAFASFNLYTNVDRRLGNGDTVTNVEVHNVIAFGGLANYGHKALTKGSRVYLTGRLHYSGGGQLLADGLRTPRIASIRHTSNGFPNSYTQHFLAIAGLILALAAIALPTVAIVAYFFVELYKVHSTMEEFVKAVKSGGQPLPDGSPTLNVASVNSESADPQQKATHSAQQPGKQKG